MSRKLILFIIFSAVILLFILFNLNNKSDISFGFTAIRDAPVFLIVFISFILGMLCAVPLMFSKKRKKEDKKPAKTQKPGGIDYTDGKDYGID